jgi:hypothetical protein
LLTADDRGASREQYDVSDVGERALQFRARQNVILELGFFYGQLGFENVFVIYKKPDLPWPNFERPSDLDGVVFDNLSEPNWKTKLGQRLRNAGFDVATSISDSQQPSASSVAEHPGSPQGPSLQEVEGGVSFRIAAVSRRQRTTTAMWKRAAVASRALAILVGRLVAGGSLPLLRAWAIGVSEAYVLRAARSQVQLGMKGNARGKTGERALSPLENRFLTENPYPSCR